MSSPGNITIKLEIQIPTGGAAPCVVVTQPEPFKKKALRILSSYPDAGDPHPVSPGFGSGSVGSICGFATFGNTPPGLVRALVYPGTANPGPCPPAEAVAGTPSMANTLWTWTDTNPVPGAAHSQSGAANTFAIWSLRAGSGSCPGGTVWDLDLIPFFGTTGSGPCGSGSGSAPAPAPMFPKQAPVPATYPAMWCLLVAGFDGPLAPFNATWALCKDMSTPTPCWDNAADGKGSPGIALKLCPKNGWELVLRFNGTEKRWTVPFSGNVFGPLAFASGGAGQPAIVATAT